MSSRYQAGIVLPGYNALLVPDAPTIGTATTSSTTTLSITFTAPANVGGGAITSYIAAAKRTSDGVVFTASGASSPITVTGLTAVPFTVTVVAVNSYGPSAPSAASNSITPALPAAGSAYGGGYFAGQISTAGNGIADYNLVVGPYASAVSNKVFKTSDTNTAGTSSVIDGPTNSSNMNNATHPAAQFCEAVNVGGYTDWYMPAQNELEVCYYNLKPTTNSNVTTSPNYPTGGNVNSVPTRTGFYTAGTPAQTSATIFQNTNSESFKQAGQYYWSSTQDSATTGAQQYSLYTGNGRFAFKHYSYPVRAVRRVAV